MNQNNRLGIDIGSTTIKMVVVNGQNELIFSDYQRHFADISESLAAMLARAIQKLGNLNVLATVTGSGGMTLSPRLPYIQEVIAVTKAIQGYAPETDVAIELGGEDAKIIYLTNGLEQRMNGICAGGTGSFIDSMASLLNTDATGLNELARNFKTLYPIASRCGVFAKTDLQPLINQGADKADLAASIFQAVANQTISGLACGRPIKGNVAFLGGPLRFLDQLRAAFQKTLNLYPEHIIDPANGHLFAAIGATENAKNAKLIRLSELSSLLHDNLKMPPNGPRLAPLFKNHEEIRVFKKRHSKQVIPQNDLSNYQGNCYLGIDAGSTTTKLALIAPDGSLLYSFYEHNHGSPVQTTTHALKDLYALLPSGARIASSCATGYGEALIKAAFNLDQGQVETIAHYHAARFFEPEVDTILDIGGQDMKYIRIKNHAVDSVLLNEACSSGCGSFLETFAQSLAYSIEDFSRIALKARQPVDLGSRCTVFMNSRVKQAQSEGAAVADIAAGLCHSVIKNALYKVIKLTDYQTLGKKVVVQGGTFLNDAVLKSFECISGIEAIRPDIAGIMGAFGAALIARDNAQGGESHLLSAQQLETQTVETTTRRCQLCSNTCLLTVSHFSGQGQHISGNRCHRGSGQANRSQPVANLYDYKLKRTFSYQSLPADQSKRGKIGIPRVLNIYENYPFWHTFFSCLSYQVVLSPLSDHKIYELGMASIPSDSACYPAKLAHGHVQWLINQGIETIFYPCIAYERKEFADANDHYNCPMVTSYPENIKNNMDGLINFEKPFLSFESREILKKRLIELFSKEKKIPPSEVNKAVDAGWTELLKARADLLTKGQEVLEMLNRTGGQGIVLSGRPYHLDPEINHGIPDLIASYGIAVLTEDSISHLGQVSRPTLVLDQWTYHSRLYAAAALVSETPHLELVQLNSFGCGLDAVACDQVSEILEKARKTITILKIDEIKNTAAINVRLRSLLAVLEKKQAQKLPPKIDTAYRRVMFTKTMKKTYTILAPQMSPIHFDFLEPVFSSCGYRFEFLKNLGPEVVSLGLQYVNNDACYPSIIVVGQMLSALFSGKYDLSQTAVMMMQTGGGCRASNYIGFIRRALSKAGLSHVPVISLNPVGLENNPGFKLSPKLLYRGLQGLIYGDVLMQVLYKTRPYEKEVGSANTLYEKWRKRCIKSLARGNYDYRKNIQGIVDDFDSLPLDETLKKPRVGIVGEIYIKYLPAANNNLVGFLENEGAEVVVPGIFNFFTYCCYDYIFNARYLGKKKSLALVGGLSIKSLEHLRRPAAQALKNSHRFTQPANLAQLITDADPIISVGNHTGEGWFLSGEICELLDSGTTHIICVQPFGCLPGHVAGKGVLKEIKRRYPLANIVAVDYDAGASEVNQLNRIKLMLSKYGIA
ncbi:acyl-CoA dehydratase activase-related protein [Eubacteriaceae bacterium ES2]|nr:acyl-CoA dehydratase activase-related protein [Eubacteriaceae bacterium ES2]